MRELLEEVYDRLCCARLAVECLEDETTEEKLAGLDGAVSKVVQLIKQTLE